MIMSALESACYQRLGWGSTPASAVTTRVDLFINQAIREILSEPSVQRLRRRDIAFSTIANASLCVLPQAATAVHTITDPTNRRELDEVTRAWMDARDPARSFSSATPLAYWVMGYASPITRDPSASGQLTVQSSSAADITQTAYLEVVTAAGYLRSLSVALTGATPVNIGPADSLYVKDIHLSAACVGEVTLVDAALNELTRIGIGKLRARYTVLEIWPKPSAVVSLNADVDLALTDLTFASDECILEEDYTELIIDGVRRREYEKREKLDLAGAAGKSFTRRMAKLKQKMAAKSALSDADRPGYSQLGPYYPNNS
jgi:hypothetical protein